jgi:hypothetical protein
MPPAIYYRNISPVTLIRMYFHERPIVYWPNKSKIKSTYNILLNHRSSKLFNRSNKLKYANPLAYHNIVIELVFTPQFNNGSGFLNTQFILLTFFLN